jgi:hypothetical protein
MEVVSERAKKETLMRQWAGMLHTGLIPPSCTMADMVQLGGRSILCIGWSLCRVV